MDRGDSHQIYHFNLLKRWQEETSVELAVAVSAEEDLGPEAAVKVNPLALVPGGDHLSPLLLTDVAKLQTDFACVFTPARSHGPHTAPYRNDPQGTGP